MPFPATHAGATVGRLVMWLTCPMATETGARGQALVEVLAQSIAQHGAA